MKKYSIALACAAILALASTSVPTAKADAVNIGGDIGVFSDYVWRGQVQTADTPAVQGDVVFSTDALEGLSATIWGSNTSGGVSEWDFVVDFSNSIGDIGYSAGGIYYTYLHDGDSNFGELYLGFSYDAIVSPSVTAYYNVNDSALTGFAKGDWWVDLGASGAVAGYDLSATLSIASYASAPGRNDADFDDGISLVTLGASKDFTVGDLVVTPSVTATIPVASDADTTATAGNVGEKLINGNVVDNEVVFGVNVAF